MGEGCIFLYLAVSQLVVLSRTLPSEDQHYTAVDVFD